MILILLFSLVSACPINYKDAKSIQTTNLPIVLMHGIISNRNNMNDLKLFLESNFKLNVIVPEIGNGIPNSFNLPLNIQGEILCNDLNSNPLLANGFNFIGVSQGGLLGRYYIERCGKYRVNNFITLVTPHGGVYKKNIGNIINMYGEHAQEHYSFSSYWRDPFNYEKYLEVSLLADLNNEYYSGNSTLNKYRFSKLSNFIMVYSINDEVVTPPESGKFSTYDIDSLDIVPLNYTNTYKSLGLDIFDKEDRLFIYKTDCLHEEHKNKDCFSQLYNMFQKFCL